MEKAPGLFRERNLAPRTAHPDGRRILLPLQRTAAYPFTNTSEVMGCGVGFGLSLSALADAEPIREANSCR
jgi:hypothetical protein